MRDAHAKLDGIIKPIDDAFWDRWYPPSDWRCRCDVVATTEPVTNENIDQLPKPEFQGNVGKDGEIFRKNGSFFRLIAGNDQALRNQEAFKLLHKPETYRTPAGNKIKISIFRDENDYIDNLKRRVMMVDKLSLDVTIRPHLDGWRNPEYAINGLIADLYKGDFKNGFTLKPEQIKTFIKKHNNTFSNKKISEEYMIVFDVTNISFNYDISRYLNGKFKAGKKLSSVILINNSNIVQLNRQDSFTVIVEKVNTLNAKTE